MGRLGEADDDEFLAFVAFDLQPGLAAPAAIDRVHPLAYDSFHLQRTDAGQEFTILGEVLAVDDPVLQVLALDQVLQPGFPLQQGKAGQVFAVEHQ